jgi:hypothetical protein
VLERQGPVQPQKTFCATAKKAEDLVFCKKNVEEEGTGLKKGSLKEMGIYVWNFNYW